MPSGRLWFVAGSSQGGKTTLVRELIGNGPPRTIAWDYKREWCSLPGFRTVTVRTLRKELAAAIKSTAPRKLAIVPVAGDVEKQFQAFAAAAWYWARAMYRRHSITIIADELSATTSAGKATGSWHRLVTQSLYLNPTIYAITQRVAESDKTAPGNASDVVAFAQSLPRDRRYMAEFLDVDEAEIRDLELYQFIHRDKRARTLTRSKLRKPRRNQPSK